jgi:hypothetical protein
MHSQRATSRPKRASPTRRSKKPVKSWFELARNNMSLRFTYYLFLCTLLPLVAIYILLVTVYGTPSPPLSSLAEVPEGDDTSASTNSSGSRTSDSDNVRHLTTQQVSAKSERMPVRMIVLIESPQAPKKNGFLQHLWGSFGSGDSSHVLQTIWCEDSLY